jgi:hypothetical protein
MKQQQKSKLTKIRFHTHLRVNLARYYRVNSHHVTGSECLNELKIKFKWGSWLYNLRILSYKTNRLRGVLTYITSV